MKQVGRYDLGRGTTRKLQGYKFHSWDSQTRSPRTIHTMALRIPHASALARLSTPGVRYYSAPTKGLIPKSKEKYVPSNGTYPKGFLVSGTYVGVKASNESHPDLAFLASETPCAAAAVFTKNKFQAAPVTISREMLRRRSNAGVRAVIINSGCANAVTGKGGLEDAEKMGAEADRCFDQSDDGKGGSTIVMSTGVIGQRWVLHVSKSAACTNKTADYLFRRYCTRSPLVMIL